MPSRSVLLAAALTGVCLLALPPAAHADAPGEALLRKVEAATRAAKTLQATLTIHREGAEDRTGAVRLLRPNYADIWLRDIPSGAERTASDGKTVLKLFEAKRQYSHAPASPDSASLTLGSPNSPVAFFFGPARLAAVGDARLLRSEKRQGSSYQVLQVTTPQPPTVRKLFIGASGLVEGVELQPSPGSIGQSFWLTSVRVDAPLKPEEFTVSVPPGYSPVPGEAALSEAVTVGQKAPGFRLDTPDGKSASLEELRKGKKATLLTFWFRNCEGCREELPHVQELYDRLRPQGLQVVAVNAGDPPDVVREFVAVHKLAFPVLLEPDAPEPVVQKAYGVSGFPANFLLDAEGRIVYSGNGWDEPAFREALAKLGIR